MGIDLIIALLALAGVYLGYQRGLIVAIFSFVSLWLGMLLAFRFSSWVAAWLGERVTVSDRWLPILAFLLVLVGVVLLVRLGAKALEGMLELAQLGIANRLAGAFLYLVLLLSLCAALFQGLTWAGLITEADRNGSIYLQHIQPFFMHGLEGLGEWLPGGKDIFKSLEKYFQSTPTA
jgi:membrane protein required for colicin V production